MNAADHNVSRTIFLRVNHKSMCVAEHAYPVASWAQSQVEIVTRPA